MKVLIVFGTRPEAIKMCPVVQAVQSDTSLECCVCVTGQHRDMLQQVLDVFKVNPDYDLHVMKKKQTLYNIIYAVWKIFCRTGSLLANGGCKCAGEIERLSIKFLKNTNQAGTLWKE